MIFQHQSILDTLYLNAEDRISKGFSKKARGRVEWFLRREEGGYYTDEKTLFLGHFRPIARDEVLLRGTHNAKNICAATAMVSDLISERTLYDVVTSFRGVHHRNEYIASIEGIPFYSSSIDSSPGRTMATLQTYIDEGIKLVTILGGKDKNSDYTGLGEALTKASRKIILCGQNAPLINESINQALHKTGKYDDIQIRVVSDYEQAVQVAVKMACEGEAVLFTPAGTSFDRYANFEERGAAFREAVVKFSR